MKLGKINQIDQSVENSNEELLLKKVFQIQFKFIVGQQSIVHDEEFDIRKSDEVERQIHYVENAIEKYLRFENKSRAFDMMIEVNQYIRDALYIELQASLEEIDDVVGHIKQLNRGYERKLVAWWKEYEKYR